MMKDIEYISIDKKPRRRKVYTQKEVNRLKTKCNIYGFINFILILVALITSIMYCGAAADSKSKDDTILELQNQIERQKKDIIDTSGKIETLSNSLNDASEIINSMTVDIETLTKELEEVESYINENMAAPEEKIYTRYTDLSISGVIDADRMDRIIDYWNSKCDGESPFVGNGKAFIKASQITGYDPIFIFAICGHESGFGTSNIARTKGNYCGIGAFDATPYSSSLNLSGNSVEQSIINNAIWIKTNYYDNNQESLDEMIYGKKCYSSSKESWISGISSIMNRSSKIK